MSLWMPYLTASLLQRPSRSKLADVGGYLLPFLRGGASSIRNWCEKYHGQCGAGRCRQLLSLTLNSAVFSGRIFCLCAKGCALPDGTIDLFQD